MKTDHRASSCPHRVIELVFGILVLMLVVVTVATTGCTTTAAPPPPPPVNVTADTYCAAARQHDWSVDDTKETIDGIRKSNAGYAKRCEDAKKNGAK